MDGRSATAQLFRERLQRVLQRAGTTPSGFARSIGIDRSTLSQLLDPSNDRLPRAETLAAIASRYGASVDWLLGLTTREQLGADIIEQVLQIEGQAVSPVDDRFMRWSREAQGSRIRTVPRYFPDFLKHEDIIRFEYAAWLAIDTETTVRDAHARLGALRSQESDLEACTSFQALDMFAT